MLRRRGRAGLVAAWRLSCPSKKEKRKGGKAPRRCRRALKTLKTHRRDGRSSSPPYLRCTRRRTRRRRCTAGSRARSRETAPAPACSRRQSVMQRHNPLRKILAGLWSACLFTRTSPTTVTDCCIWMESSTRSGLSRESAEMSSCRSVAGGWLQRDRSDLPPVAVSAAVGFFLPIFFPSPFPQHRPRPHDSYGTEV